MFRFTTKIGNLKHSIISEISDSAEQRNYVCSKPFHLVAILRDVLANGVQQDHLGPGVDHLASPRTTSSGVPDAGNASTPGISP